MLPVFCLAFASLPGSMVYGWTQDAAALKARESRSSLVDRESPKSPSESNSTGPAGMIGWSVVVLAALGAFLYGMRRWASKTPALSGSGPIEILGRRRVNSQQEIVLVKIRTRTFVLAAGSGGLSVLSEFSDLDKVVPGERVPAVEDMAPVGSRD